MGFAGKGNTERSTPIYFEELAVALGKNHGVDGAHPVRWLPAFSLRTS